jgi:hypothetical protein
VRVLVDTSVWSLSLRRTGPVDHPTVRKLQALLKGHEDLVLTGTILQEVLQAFRDDSTVRRVAASLEPFPLLPLGRPHYVAAARLHRQCAAHGVAASTIDCQIAAAALEHGCLLLTADDDFRRIAEYTPLRLV